MATVTSPPWNGSETVTEWSNGDSLKGLYTCLACQIGFHTADLQRQHYRTDWHRYNLKRKIAELPPVTAEIFAQKVLAQQDQLRISASQANFSQPCVPCKKTFYSQNAYNNHLSSKRHRLATLRPNRLAVLKDDNESIAGSIGSSLDMMDSVASLDGSVRAIEEGVNHMEIVDEEEEAAAKIARGEQLPPEICLFCLYPSANMEENISHMGLAHGLFIPEKEYLTDLRGLIVYLGEKIGVGNACIYCNKTFTSAEGARAHMIDKGHCKMAYSSSSEILEYSDFYDFSTSYPTETVVEDDNDSSWSDDPDSDTSSIASEDLRPVQVTHDVLELRLPHVGKRLGHRTLARYYRQNLRPERSVSSGEQTHRLLLEGPGGVTVGGKTAIGVRKFGERSMMVEASKRRHAERESRRFRDQREREQFRTGVAFRKTAEFKKYFRDPLLQ